MKDKPSTSNRRETQVFMTLLLVALVFILCWAPLQTYVFLSYSRYNIGLSSNAIYVLLFLSYFNLLLDSILYRSIRQSVVQILTRSNDIDTSLQIDIDISFHCKTYLGLCIKPFF